MRFIILATAAALAAVPARAQQPPASLPNGEGPVGTGGAGVPLSTKPANLAPSPSGSVIAPRLPSPSLGENATAKDYLMAARKAISQGQLGMAQEALERAETWVLDRSVRPSQVRNQITDPAVEDISGALHALAAQNTAEAQRRIDAALGKL
jgi:hypothetical protein